MADMKTNALRVLTDRMPFEGTVEYDLLDSINNFLTKSLKRNVRYFMLKVSNWGVVAALIQEI